MSHVSLTDRASPPIASCLYDIDNGGPNGVPNLTKSFGLEMWAYQKNASSIYSDIENHGINPYKFPACDPVTVPDVGDQAVWSGGTGCSGSYAGTLLFQPNADNVVLLWGLPETTSISAANQISSEMGGPSGGSALGNSGPSGVSKSNTGSTGNSGQGHSNTFPTTSTTTPTTTTTSTAMPLPPTTTTTPLPPQQQKFVDDVEAQFPTIGTSIASGADNGYLTNQSLAAAGESICTSFSQISAPSSGISGDPYPLVLTNATQQLQQWSLGSNTNVFMDLSIQDLCPEYTSDIPPGE